jgi:hypothetical protein
VYDILAAVPPEFGLFQVKKLKVLQLDGCKYLQVVL